MNSTRIDPKIISDQARDINHLVLNLYHDGYTIAVKLNQFPIFTSESVLETAKISYQETSLLSYIENGELPPLLVEMIDGSPKLSQYRLWHNGCLVLEVRDKIMNTNRHGPKNDVTNQDRTNSNYFTILKPTNLSMYNDLLILTESNAWSNQDKLRLESEIVLHNSPTLFLEPNASNHPNVPSSPQSVIKLPRAIIETKSCESHQVTTEKTAQTLPPELSLQQFLANKRATKKVFPHKPKHRH